MKPKLVAVPIGSAIAIIAALAFASPVGTQGTAVSTDPAERNTISDHAEALRNGSLEVQRADLATDPEAIVRAEAPGFVLMGSIVEDFDGQEISQAQYVNDDNTAIHIAWQTLPDDFDLSMIYDEPLLREDEDDGESTYKSNRVVTVTEKGGVQTLTSDNRGWSRQVIVLARSTQQMVNLQITVAGQIDGPARNVDDPYTSGPDLVTMTRMANDILSAVSEADSAR